MARQRQGPVVIGRRHEPHARAERLPERLHGSQCVCRRSFRWGQHGPAVGKKVGIGVLDPFFFRTRQRVSADKSQVGGPFRFYGRDDCLLRAAYVRECRLRATMNRDCFDFRGNAIHRRAKDDEIGIARCLGEIDPIFIDRA